MKVKKFYLCCVCNAQKANYQLLQNCPYPCKHRCITTCYSKRSKPGKEGYPFWSCMHFLRRRILRKDDISFRAYFTLFMVQLGGQRARACLLYSRSLVQVSTQHPGGSFAEPTCKATRKIGEGLRKIGLCKPEVTSINVKPPEKCTKKLIIISCNV